MKPVTVALSIAALALPLTAADQTQNRPNTTSTVLAQPLSVTGQDSPLVRAAKATGRLNKKPGFVITNDNLVRTGGHITTTTIQNPLPPAPKANVSNDAAAAAARVKADADTKAKHDSDVKKEKQLRNAAADFYGESLEERVDDPAMQEHIMNQMTTTQPKTATPSKPPQE